MDYSGLPYPKGYAVQQLGNKLICDECNYDTSEQLEEFNKLYQNLICNIELDLKFSTIIYVFGMAGCINPS